MKRQPCQPRVRAKGSWSFYSKPDIARVLREAEEAGFDLVEVRQAGLTRMYATVDYIRNRLHPVKLHPAWDRLPVTLPWEWAKLGPYFNDTGRTFTAKQLHAELLRREAEAKAELDAKRVTVVGYA